MFEQTSVFQLVMQGQLVKGLVIFSTVLTYAKMLELNAERVFISTDFRSTIMSFSVPSL